MIKSYEFEVKKWGFILTFSGRVCKHDLDECLKTIGYSVRKLPRKFHVILDFTKIEPLCMDTSRTLAMVRAFLIGRGMAKIVIIYNSMIQIIELTTAFQQTQQDFNERYISIHTHADYMKPALDWILNGIEP